MEFFCNIENFIIICKRRVSGVENHKVNCHHRENLKSKIIFGMLLKYRMSKVKLHSAVWKQALIATAVLTVAVTGNVGTALCHWRMRSRWLRAEACSSYVTHLLLVLRRGKWWRHVSLTFAHLHIFICTEWSRTSATYSLHMFYLSKTKQNNLHWNNKKWCHIKCCKCPTRSVFSSCLMQPGEQFLCHRNGSPDQILWICLAQENWELYP
jgi:hypothetical protein